jgi:hypothetical protein
LQQPSLKHPTPATAVQLLLLLQNQEMEVQEVAQGF